MRSQWESLRAGLVRSLEASEAIAMFTELRSRSDALAGLGSPAELVASLSSDAGLDARDPTLWALVEAARDRRVGRLAQSLLLLGLWPALDAIFRKRFSLFTNRPQDLASEIVASFTLEVQRIDLSRVTCLTATLLRNTDRNLTRRRCAELRLARRSTEVAPDVATVEPPEPFTSPFGLTVNQSDTDSIAALSAWLHHAIGNEADVVIDAVLAGMTCAQIAKRIGISHAAARKRLCRALARARVVFFAENQSQVGPSTAFAN
jgi:DNA-directed RNA polymerase specialized sigma24 family protein